MRYTPSTPNTISGIRSELNKIQQAINTMLDREGTAPNQMNAPLDMNGYSISNAIISGVDMDEIFDELNDAVASAAASANTATTQAGVATIQANNASASANEASSSASEASTDAAQVATDKLIVEGYRDEVEADAAQVALDRIASEDSANSAADSEANAAISEGNAATSEGNALSSENAAAISEANALASELEAAVSAGEAAESALLALSNANQTFVSGGLFNPTAMQEYPDVVGVERDTIWIIQFDGPETTYTYTTGDLVGKTTLNGFMLFYDVPANTFTLIPTSISGAVSVAGISADPTGDVPLVANDLDAYEKGEVDALLADKADVATTYTKDEVVTLLESVNDHRIGSIERFSPLYTPPTDEYVRMQGATVNRSNYQKLFDKMNTTDNMVTDAEWLFIQSSSPNGAVAVYSSGDGSTTFRLPTTGDNGVFGRDKGAITDPILLQIGQQDQIVNITATWDLRTADFEGTNQSLPVAASGAGTFYKLADQTLGASAELGTTYASRDRLEFDASRQVNTGAEVTPNHVYESWYIYTGKTSLV